MPPGQLTFIKVFYRFGHFVYWHILWTIFSLLEILSFTISMFFPPLPLYHCHTLMTYPLGFSPTKSTLTWTQWFPSAILAKCVSYLVPICLLPRRHCFYFSIPICQHHFYTEYFKHAEKYIELCAKSHDLLPKPNTV